MNFTHALKWSFLSELAFKAIQPIVFVVLARLLTPEDYGVMSSALMVISFSQIFWEAGMSKALIQRQGDVCEAANVAFWINIVMGCVIATVLYLVAGPVARTFFHDERVTAVLHVMTIQIFLGAVSAVHTALLLKEMEFKKLFWVRLVTISLPGLASIPLAYNGMGYWALVAGSLVGQMAQVIMLWRMSTWRPKLDFDKLLAKELVRFGVWVGVSGLMAWGYGWADSLIVGMYLGSHDLGLYRTGSQFAIMIYGSIFSPIMPVLYSHLSRMNADKIRLGIAIQKVIKVITLVAVPIAVIIFSLSEPISAVVFGEKWRGIGFVIGVLSLTHGFSWIVSMNGEVYRAMGKPRYETIVTFVPLTIYLGAYLLSIRQGFEVFVWTRLGLMFGGLFFQLFVLRKVMSISIMPIITYIFTITILVAVIATAVKFFSNIYLEGAWWQMMVGGVFNVLIVGAAVFLVERNGVVKDLIGLIRARAV